MGLFSQFLYVLDFGLGRLVVSECFFDILTDFLEGDGTGIFFVFDV